jgi:hypothetical protein
MLKHAEVIVWKDQRITTQQLALSLTNSKEPHQLKPWTFKRVHKMVSSQLNTKLKERLKERQSYITLLKQMKPRPSILNWRKKGNPWNGTILKLSRIKNSKSLLQ